MVVPFSVNPKSCRPRPLGAEVAVAVRIPVLPLPSFAVNVPQESHTVLSRV